jgi:hypothetical protein
LIRKFFRHFDYRSLTGDSWIPDDIHADWLSSEFDPLM